MLWYLLVFAAGQASILAIQYVMLRNSRPPKGLLSDYDGEYTQH